MEDSQCIPIQAKASEINLGRGVQSRFYHIRDYHAKGRAFYNAKKTKIMDSDKSCCSRIWTKRIRVNEFFQDYDKLRSGYVSAPQFFRCLWQTLSLKFNEDEERALCLKYGLLDNGKINYKSFCDVIDLNFDPKNIYASPELQKVVPLEYLGTIRSKRPLTVDSESRLVGILRRMQQFYNVRGINLRTQYEDFDRHHRGVVSESQFYRNFPGPIDIDEEDMKTLVEKYNDPNNPGLVNYLNLHHDVLAVHKFVLAEKDPGQNFVDRNVDMVSLFPTKDPTLSEILDKVRVSVYKNGIRTIEFFKDHDKLRSGVITENQFVCGLALACGKEAQLSRPEIQKVVEYYRLPDGRIQYKEFCDSMENAFNIPDLEKKPTESVQRPLRGTLSRGLKPLSEIEEQRLCEVINTIADKVATDRIMIYQYFKDYDRSKAYTRVVTPTQFARILHFLGLNVNNQDLLLLLNKFQDPASGDVNYPAFVQAVDREFVGHTIDDADISDQNRTNVVIQAKEDKWVESPPVNFEELMARIRHIVLANRLRVNEYFQDYDGLRSGSISIPQFRRGLAVMGLSKLGHHDLNDNQFKQLVDYYRNPAKHNNGHITRTQFRQAFKILEIPVEEPELHCLEALYCNDVGVCYTAFLADLEPQEPVPFMYVKRMEELRLTNCKQALPEQRAKSDLESVFLKIKTKVCKERLRVYEFMKDYDKLRSGRMLKTSFRRALNLARLDLLESEVAMLEDKYQSGCDPDFVEYLRFCQEIESIFTKDHLEKSPLEEVEQFKPDEEWTVTELSADEEEKLNCCLLRIAEKVRKHQMQLFPLFEDYDRVHNGAVSQSQFRRVLMELELASLASDTDVKLIWRKYQMQVGGRTDVNYIAFCEKVCDLAGFEYRKP
ncbi:hypothetical protein ElyMa_001958300 [Elysia marginata]|uniref:EF-hand domain-containing protein n=1 Tax=Elysia marginata TaxID=1093978 RepID=A0AAV4EZD4_9GAST|nr:hypothetical protein ElyMa_001958300 [Elysia marginata]